jgi:acyl-CoA reductase-like NAD-dependent aldehyde dehydrogenase
MLHLPLLRAGRPYASVERIVLRHVSTGEPVAEVSQANPGSIARDLSRTAEARREVAPLAAAELVEICGRAAELFRHAELPVDPLAGTSHGPEDYVRHLSATTGMPHALVRGNMEKIRHVLAEMSAVLGGLTRGLELSALDEGWAAEDGRLVGILAQADALGVVLPSNSPGVHSLWLPAIPLKMPLVLRPGRQEPWTPLRVCQALIAAGCPERLCGFYPSGYDGAIEILLRTSRSMLFGDASTVAPWEADPRVQIHGPGWSKVVFGPDAAPRWRDQLELVVESIAVNGGRSCLNASAIWTPAGGRELAQALAERLAAIEPRPLAHPDACLAAFSDPRVARRISEKIDVALAQPGAVDLTRGIRGSERLVELDGCTFLRPTLVWCEDPSHPLANQEFLFPYAAVVQLPPSEVWQRMGPTLVATVISDDEAFLRGAIAARAIDRLNLGAIPTTRVAWDQPHEGNLFEHLYRRRALERAAGAA